MAEDKWRADVVGSMLRPPELVEARKSFRAGKLAPDEYAAVEDEAVDSALRIQEEAGVDVVTDGEMRRDIFFDFFVSGMDGLSPIPSYTVVFRDDRGNDKAHEVTVPFSVTEQIRPHPCPALKEFDYARTRTDKPIKVTLPSPTLVLGFYAKEHSSDAYPDPFDLVADAAAAVNGWIDELVDAGCRHIQIDAPELAEVFADEAIREEYRGRGISPETMMEVGPEVLASLAERDRPGLTLAVHLCKGNGTQSWIAEGGYEALSEALFARAERFDAFHLEYDDERSGSFEPLANLPDETLAVLGLVSTKWKKLEDPDALRARIEEASRFHPMDRLAIATQCGFASAAETAEDRKITPQVQAEKLKLVADVARSVWG
jgi:5-methyltetrahydropteroyltriglutamate--homocysteine methyltransferase